MVIISLTDSFPVIIFQADIGHEGTIITTDWTKVLPTAANWIGVTQVVSVWAVQQVGSSSYTKVTGKVERSQSHC